MRDPKGLEAQASTRPHLCRVAAAESLNGKLAALAARVAEQPARPSISRIMHDFDVPSYDGDVETAQGIPAGATELQRRLTANDAFIIASPEYNGSMPGVIKNLIDWTSRFRPQPFDARHGAPDVGVAVAGRRQSRSVGAARAARAPGRARLPRHVLAVDGAQGVRRRTTSPTRRCAARFEKTSHAFLSLAEAAKHYPCIKRAWVEFLGEPPSISGADRVDPLVQ